MKRIEKEFTDFLLHKIPHQEDRIPVYASKISEDRRQKIHDKLLELGQI